MNVSHEQLDIFACNPSELLQQCAITVDEYGLHTRDKTTVQTMGGSASKKVKNVQENRKVIGAVFWDSQYMVIMYSLGKGKNL